MAFKALFWMLIVKIIHSLKFNTMKERIEIAQRILKDKGYYKGKLDGDAGPQTKAAIKLFKEVNASWPLTRQITIIIQLGAKEHNIDPGPADGYWGQRTNSAFEHLKYLFKHGTSEPPWRPEEKTSVNPNNWPIQNTPEFHDFYGEKGTNLVIIDFPYEMKISWDLRIKVRRTTCHAKVADSLGRVLTKVKEIYGEEEINRLSLNNYGGCFNMRRMRGGSQWSTHSWGIALDFDPSRNQLKWGRDQASFAHPDYNDWWKCWEEEGWVSLGRERNFDWMHVQATKLE